MDAIVVGGGQAGVAMGFHLAKRHMTFAILEAASEIGDSWRSRWDSLVLFTPSQFDALPGLPFPAAPDVYPTKDEVADYLAGYAKTFELPVRTNSPVLSVRKADRGYVVATTVESLGAPVVVVATGPFQRPLIPHIANRLASDVHQIHSAEYRNPQSLPGERVLVVGGGTPAVKSRRISLGRAASSSRSAGPSRGFLSACSDATSGGGGRSSASIASRWIRRWVGGFEGAIRSSARGRSTSLVAMASPFAHASRTRPVTG